MSSINMEPSKTAADQTKRALDQTKRTTSTTSTDNKKDVVQQPSDKKSIEKKRAKELEQLKQEIAAGAYVVDLGPLAAKLLKNSLVKPNSES